MIVNLYKNDILGYTYTIPDNSVIDFFGNNDKKSFQVQIRGNDTEIKNDIRIYHAVKQCNKINLILDNFSTNFLYNNAKIYIENNKISITFIKEV